MDLEGLLSQMFEFLLTIAGSRRMAPALERMVPELVRLSLGALLLQLSRASFFQPHAFQPHTCMQQGLLLCLAGSICLQSKESHKLQLLSMHIMTLSIH